MTMYFTKTYGFDVPCGPLHFSKEGWRKRAREELKPGDLVLVVGTKGEETRADEQGRLLGIMEPTTEPILSQDYDLEKRSVDFDKNGNFRWPFGLINRCAWKITDRRLFGEISNRKFRREGSLGIDPLTAEETTAVMQLAREEVRLLLPIRARARIEGDSVARRRVSPPPALTRQGIMYLRREPAFTYAMSIERARGGSFKIGWAFDYTLRQRQFNQAAMPTLGGLEYRTVLHRLWDTAQQAYRMEQWLLQQFDANRHLENHEVIVGVPYSELEDSWVSYLQHSSGR